MACESQMIKAGLRNCSNLLAAVSTQDTTDSWSFRVPQGATVLKASLRVLPDQAFAYHRVSGRSMSPNRLLSREHVLKTIDPRLLSSH